MLKYLFNILCEKDKLVDAEDLLLEDDRNKKYIRKFKKSSYFKLVGLYIKRWTYQDLNKAQRIAKDYKVLFFDSCLFKIIWFIFWCFKKESNEDIEIEV